MTSRACTARTSSRWSSRRGTPSARTPTAGASRCSWRRSTPCSASSFTAFKNLEIVLYLGFLTAFYALIRNRIDRLAALLIISAVVLDTLYTSWTNTVLTEFPFLCSAMLSLLVIDALHREGRLPRGRRPSERSCP